MSKRVKVDEYWKILFEKYDILEVIEKTGEYIIDSNQIKSIDNNEIHAEPRLLTKFDRCESLPKIFRDNHLSILPTSRGSYVISHINTHHKFEKEIENNIRPVFFSFPNYIESIDLDNITTEAIALNCAYISGILEDFIGDDKLKPAVNGRMGSNSFDFYIQNTVTQKANKINVEKAQIEIDAAYEGVKYLSIIEAKCNLGDDFLIRQLYYPYRLWLSKMKKEIKMIFMTYSNKIFTLYEYKFENPNCYNSLKLSKAKCYTLENVKITLNDIRDVLSSIEQVSLEPDNIPFPQADNFERVINICELVKNSSNSIDDITEYNLFTGRQANYYISACKYLGLVESKGEYCLTSLGKKILSLPQKERILAFSKCVLSTSVFNKVMRISLERGEFPSDGDIVMIMKENIGNLSDETYKRRAQTVKSWINWILNKIQ